MKLEKNHYKKKLKKKNKNNFFRINTFNIQQKIDVIEEEDNESSTSEKPKEKNIDSNINIKKEIKDEKIIDYIDFVYMINVQDEKLKDLINKCLKVNPDERISWEEYFEHPFFKQYEY